MGTPTSSYGYELAIADDAGHDDIPVCCSDDMTAKNLDDGGIEYTCGSCGTVLEIDELGLVFDIREKQPA